MTVAAVQQHLAYAHASVVVAVVVVAVAAARLQRQPLHCCRCRSAPGGAEHGNCGCNCRSDLGIPPTLSSMREAAGRHALRAAGTAAATLLNVAWKRSQPFLAVNELLLTKKGNCLHAWCSDPQTDPLPRAPRVREGAGCSRVISASCRITREKSAVRVVVVGGWVGGAARGAVAKGEIITWGGSLLRRLHTEQTGFTEFIKIKKRM